MRRTVLLVALLIGVPVSSAGAAGVTTHAFMADKAIPLVKTPELRELLTAQRDAYLSGAAFPDGGYAVGSLPGGDYGEISHWERFVNAYVAHLRQKALCQPLTRSRGLCAAQVAHALGAAAHGMGDEMWDWLFEPQVADHHERPDHPIFESGLPGFAELAQSPAGAISTVEYAMDMVAIKDHVRWLEISPYLPAVGDLLAAYRAIGRSDITATGLLAGHAAISTVIGAERAGAVLDAERVRAQMPWSSAHFYSESGGVQDTAEAVAGYLEGLWAKVRGGHDAPRLAHAHPEPGETGTPWDWEGVSMAPGPREGGGAHRIVAVLSNALDGLSVGAHSFQLLGPGGEAVAPAPGFPRAGPYHHTDGTHSMIFRPAGNLAPCTAYTARVTTALRDMAGVGPAAPLEWSFTTACA